LTKKIPREETEIVPHIYLDANVIVDIIQGYRKASIHMIEEIKEENWFCSTSAFSYMEVLDIMQDNRFIYDKVSQGYPLKKIMRMRYDKDLSEETLDNIFDQFENKFLIPYKSMNLFDLTDHGWEIAVGICSASNISAPDSIHLATALEAGCDLLVTSDESFRKNASIFTPACLPEKFKKTLKELEFDV